MGKNIIMCCDGTGNEYFGSKTNVVKMFEAIIHKRNPDQFAYYDPGVGTIGSTAALSNLGKKFTRVLGLAFAVGLTKNIEEAYEFLMEYYNKGDKVFLFGFSRGAYTVRALSGLLTRCGLLHKMYKNQIPYAVKLYRNYKKKYGLDRVREFKETFARTCNPHFIGVWDTVKSTGLFGQYKFSDFVLNENIEFGFHALAIDEKRRKFRCLPWEPPTKNQVIEQVWFPGVHCDIGGSYREDGLSNIALHWMAEKAKAQGLDLSKEVLNKYPPNCRTKKHTSFKGLWILLWKKIRKIKEGSNIHECVYQKIKLDPDYKPKNLPDREIFQIVGKASDCGN